MDLLSEDRCVVSALVPPLDIFGGESKVLALRLSGAWIDGGNLVLKIIDPVSYPLFHQCDTSADCLIACGHHIGNPVHIFATDAFRSGHILVLTMASSVGRYMSYFRDVTKGTVSVTLEHLHIVDDPLDALPGVLNLLNTLVRVSIQVLYGSFSIGHFAVKHVGFSLSFLIMCQLSVIF